MGGENPIPSPPPSPLHLPLSLPRPLLPRQFSLPRSYSHTERTSRIGCKIRKKTRKEEETKNWGRREENMEGEENVDGDAEGNQETEEVKIITTEKGKLMGKQRARKR